MSDPYDQKSNDSILGPTLHFKGDLSAEEDLVILGSVEGSIKHTAQLTIGEQGKIKADIEAASIRVDGKVVGNLSASSSVNIRPKANVVGNVNAPSVSLAEGARFKGRIDMEPGKATSSSSQDAQSAKPKTGTAAA